MPHIDSIRDAALRGQQFIRNRANLSTRFSADSLREVAGRATLTGVRRALRDGESAVNPPQLDQLTRDRGLGNLIDRKA